MKRAAAAALLAAAVLCASLADAHAFSICKSSQDLLGVKAVSFSPDPPQAGKTLVVKVEGVSGENLEHGTVKVDVKVMGIQVTSETLSLCSVVACPLVSDQAYSAQFSQEIPSETPDHINAVVRVSVLSEQGQVLSCLESTVAVENAALLASTEGNRWKQLENHVDFFYGLWRKQFPKAVHGTVSVFLANVRRVFEHSAHPDRTYEMALNEFAGMTAEEFGNSRLGYRHDMTKARADKAPVQKLLRSVALADPPLELDWVSKGAVTPVKNQGACGSCWAFSAVAAIESAYAIKSGLQAQFSEQELVSCDDEDFGCQGGLMDNAFDWIEKHNGLCAEDAYPYTSGATSARGMCMTDQCQVIPGTVPTSFIDIPPNEAALLAAVAQHGPVSVAIEADQSAFQFYHSGVLTGACGNHLNHGVLLVGYGIDTASGVAFWKVKNSWGTGWGEEGYVRMQRGKRWPSTGGECGIATKASFPVL